MKISRRHFLQTSAAVAAFNAVPLLAAPGRKYRTALIGAGWWGPDHHAHGFEYPGHTVRSEMLAEQIMPRVSAHVCL